MKSLIHHHSKRWWMIVIVSMVIGLSVVVYAIYSLMSCSSYHEHTQQWQTTTKQRLDTALALQATSPDQRSRRLTALKATTAYIRSSQTSTCKPARLTGWQLAFEGPKRMRGACAMYSKKVGLISGQLSRVTGYLEDEAQVTNLLRPALKLSGTVNEASWQQTATVWSQAHTSISNLSASSEFNRTKQEAVSVTLALETTWKELIAAHDAKDKARFVAAITKVQEAYTRLAGISTVNDSQLTFLTIRLQQLYSDL